MKPIVSVRVEPAMKAKLEIIAEKSTLSVPNLLQLAFLEFICKWEKEHGKITSKELNQQQLFHKNAE